MPARRLSVMKKLRFSLWLGAGIGFAQAAPAADFSFSFGFPGFAFFAGDPYPPSVVYAPPVYAPPVYYYGYAPAPVYRTYCRVAPRYRYARRWDGGGWRPHGHAYGRGH